ncbi:hypothetical protein U9M48_015603 [Paspalum notatum var. saurae]|uniref:Uncharacterized protein n=1 Tax=Paspalum notatum var. saurae TaxID=547442 RepID=A0AAQ3WLP6_PASNO
MAAMVRGPAMAPAAGPGARAAAAVAAAAAAEEMRWRQIDSGVSAVSFGFVATAILVSMFLAMAIFEHFLRPPAAHAAGPGPGHAPPAGFFRRLRLHLRRGGAAPGAALEAPRKPESHAPREKGEHGLCRCGFEREVWLTAANRQGPSPVCSHTKIPVYPKGVSVLMPGQDMPTFIAHPAPVPCPPERIQWPSHQPAPSTITGSSSAPS